MALSHYGVVGNLHGYHGCYNDEDRPEDIVNAVANEDVDVAIVWGPLAGYFAKQSKVPLKITPLAERDSLDRLPLPLQHRDGRAAQRPGAAGQPGDGAQGEGTRRSRRS